MADRMNIRADAVNNDMLVSLVTALTVLVLWWFGGTLQLIMRLAMKSFKVLFKL